MTCGVIVAHRPHQSGLVSTPRRAISRSASSCVTSIPASRNARRAHAALVLLVATI